MQITPPRDTATTLPVHSGTGTDAAIQQVNEAEPYPRIDGPLPSRPWRGRERRRSAGSGSIASGHHREGGERRQGERRQRHLPVLLDTRSRHERRTQTRRVEDAAQPKRYPRLRGIDIVV